MTTKTAKPDLENLRNENPPLFDAMREWEIAFITKSSLRTTSVHKLSRAYAELDKTALGVLRAIDKAHRAFEEVERERRGVPSLERPLGIGCPVTAEALEPAERHGVAFARLCRLSPALLEWWRDVIYLRYFEKDKQGKEGRPRKESLDVLAKCAAQETGASVRRFALRYLNIRKRTHRSGAAAAPIFEEMIAAVKDDNTFARSLDRRLQPRKAKKKKTPVT